MMVATFKCNPYAAIISCNSPTNARDETDLIIFYNELSSLVRNITKHNIPFISGNMKAQLLKQKCYRLLTRKLTNMAKY